MTPLDALRDDLCQILADEHHHTLGLPLVQVRDHPFALADYRARVQPLMGRIATELARVVVEHSPHGRVDPLFSWDPNARPCCQRNAGGDGPLVCERRDPHATGHQFAATSGINTKSSEPTGAES